jgi:hypothetical protein
MNTLTSLNLYNTKYGYPQLAIFIIVIIIFKHMFEVEPNYFITIHNHNSKKEKKKYIKNISDSKVTLSKRLLALFVAENSKQVQSSN